jgi:hypothetical protein
MKFLQDFDFVLKHIPRHANTIANLLSHRKDLNKGVNSHTHILLPLSLFLCQVLRPNIAQKIYLRDGPEKEEKFFGNYITPPQWDTQELQTPGH